MVKCPECGKEVKPLGLSAHRRIVHLGFRDLIQKGNAARQGKPSWNSGLRGDPRCKVSEETKQKLRVTPTGKCKDPEKEAERIRKITEYARLNNGGLRHGSGRGKKGRFAGIWCDSSWELAFIIWCRDNEYNIERAKKSFPYTLDDGKEHLYYPDFLVNGELVEIKGRKQIDSVIAAKLKAAGDIKIFLANDMEPILQYVIGKYGKDFINLYEVK